MVSVRLAVVAAALFWAAPATADPLDRWSAPIAEASERFGVPAEWIRRVMRAESGGRTVLRGRPITSHAGAMGLMQLMPNTWREMRATLGLGHDPHEPRDNILAGTAYLRLMHDRFGYPGLFAAYNAGPARYAAHLARGRPLPAETIAYVAVVAGGGRPANSAARDAADQTVTSRPALFALVRASDAATPALPAATRSAEGALFVPLRGATHP